MFRIVSISKQSPNIHTRLTTPLLSNEILYRNVSFKVKPAEDKVWRDYRHAVWKVRQECKVENRKKRAAEEEKQRIYDETYSFENLFGPAFKYAEGVNQRQKEKREAQEQFKMREAEQEEKSKPIRENEKIEKDKSIENILQREIKKAEQYITETDIEQALEEALNNPIVLGFAFPKTKVSGDGRGPKNFDENGEIIKHESLPYIK